MLLRTILLAALLAATPALPAEPPPASEAEIQHLLDYLGDSGCQFFRNGAWHPARDARAHIQKKYAYLLDKGMVKTAPRTSSPAPPPRAAPAGGPTRCGALAASRSRARSGSKRSSPATGRSGPRRSRHESANHEPLYQL